MIPLHSGTSPHPIEVKLHKCLDYMREGWSYHVACSKAGIKFTKCYEYRKAYPWFDKAAFELMTPKAKRQLIKRRAEQP